MTTNRPWTLDAKAVPERPVDRARLLLSAADDKAIVLDADTGEFTALASTPPYSMPLALSPDGTQMLFWSRADNGAILLLLRTLATGLHQPIGAPPDFLDCLAAVSPDGHTIAVLSDYADSGFIDLFQIATGTRRHLWSGEGGASMLGTSIAWSPDGDLIAATYYHTPTDELATVTVDAGNGAVVAHYEYRVALGCPNGTWIDNSRMLLIDDTADEFAPPLYIVDVRSGDTRRISRPPQWEFLLALVNGRMLARSDDGNYYLTDLDGNDPELFLTMTTDLGISTFDIAPSVISKS